MNNLFTQHSKARLLNVLLLLVFYTLICGCSNPSLMPIAQSRLASAMPREGWLLAQEELNATQPTCDNNKIAFEILVAVASYDFIRTDPDILAKKYHSFIQSNCTSNDKHHANYLMGKYYINTNRHGKSLSWLLKAQELVPSNAFEQGLIDAALASAYNSMGQFEMRDDYISRALSQCSVLSADTDKSINTRMKWLEYKSIIESKIFWLSKDLIANNKTEMKKLWDAVEKIGLEQVPLEGMWETYIKGVSVFSGVDNPLAWDLLRKAEKYSALYSNNKNTAAMKLGLKQAEIDLLIADGLYEEAAKQAENYLNAKRSISGQSLSSDDYRIAGLAYEKAGKYEKAIDYLKKSIAIAEGTRATFEIDQRKNFLNEQSIKPYWGLLRSYGARYVQNKNRNDLLQAIATETKLRARQLSDIAGIKIDPAGLNINDFVLSKDELILDYVVTDNSIVLIAVGADWQSVEVLPIEPHKINTKIFELKENLSKISNIEQTSLISAELGDFLLKPLKQTLSGYKRLIIISDGALNTIPFSVLTVDGEPVINSHEMFSVPSLAFLKDQRSKPKWAGDDTLLAVADPVYSTKHMPDNIIDAKSRSVYTRAVSDIGIFMPLKETRDEVNGIASLFSNGTVTYLFGNDASKKKLYEIDLAGYRYLHFATHGILGNMVLGVSEPALVLTAGTKFDDSFLKLSEIERLKLTSELTVLSACDTGNGKYFTGEGVMGLSRGFLLAGSKSVLVTLWPIDSNSTVQFMISFYKYIKEGKDKSAALRLAQLNFMKSSNTLSGDVRGLVIKNHKSNEVEEKSVAYNNPYFWAPFILVGE